MDYRGALPKMVNDSCGILVNYKNIEEVVSALRKLSRDHKLTRCLGKSGRLRAQAHFTRTVVKAKMLSVVNQLVGESNQSG